ncbi:hypothetical protein DFQ30_011060 [Apophysomyces sp. BC1015]|nr:hypothetical protein DFQ30_011060 [Apophysomyces sp. BC1015]
MSSPKIDHLNAALSSATSKSIDNQVDYLTKYIGRNTEASDKWKLVNVFLGTNDVAASCIPGYDAILYRQRMKDGIQRLLDNVDNVLVNIVGIFHFEDIQYITERDKGYRKSFKGSNMDLQTYECICCKLTLEELEKKLVGTNTLKLLDALPLNSTETIGTAFVRFQVGVFNDMLREITAEFALNRNERSAVVYQPFHLDVNSVPATALR